MTFIERPDIIDQPTDVEEKRVRPVILTVTCVMSFFGSAIAIPVILSDTLELAEKWYPPYFGFSIAFGLASMLGLWYMKKWGAYGYTALVMLNQVVMLYIGAWKVWMLPVPVTVIIVAMWYLNKMD